MRVPCCTDLSGISASDVELVGISRDGVIIEHRLLTMIARVWYLVRIKDIIVRCKVVTVYTL